MIFSKKCQYAIRALTHLAQTHQVCRAHEISRSQKVPYPFVAKILQELHKKDFVKSVRGPGGGFLLARPAGKVRLIDVLSAMDGNQAFEACLYGLNECSESMPCPMHAHWKMLRAEIETYLHSHTIGDLAPNRIARKSKSDRRPV